MINYIETQIKSYFDVNYTHVQRYVCTPINMVYTISIQHFFFSKEKKCPLFQKYRLKQETK